MKISVLGSNGFLSSSIASFFINKGWGLDIYGLYEPKGHSFDNFYKVDLMNSTLNYAMLLDSDIIVYAIGAGIQADLKEGANLIYKLNVSVPVALCSKLEELSYKGCFVTFGSVFEMGETTEQKLFNEEEILTSLAPSPNDYTTSKRMLSRFVSSYRPHFTHWHFYIPTIYGMGENPKRLIPYVVNSLLNGDEMHFTSGVQTRQYLHVSEVAVMLLCAYENKLTSGVYNIEGSETLTVKSIVEMIHDILGKKLPNDCFGSMLRDDAGMKYLALDGSKLFSAIGFRAEKTIKSSISDYIN